MTHWKSVTTCSLIALLWAGRTCCFECLNKNLHIVSEFEEMTTSVTGAKLCTASDSTCYIKYSNKGRVMWRFGCGQCIRKTMAEIINDGCYECRSAEKCNHKDASIASFTLTKGLNPCPYHDGPIEGLKDDKFVQIHCNGDKNETKCTRLEYLDKNKKAHLFLGCAFDCIEKAKTSNIRQLDGTGDPACAECVGDGCKRIPNIKTKKTHSDMNPDLYDLACHSVSSVRAWVLASMVAVSLFAAGFS